MLAFVRHYDELVDHLRRRFSDQGFAQEVVNDVCVRLLEKPPAEEVREPRAFLQHVATHLTIDRYRVQSARAAIVHSTDELPELPGLPVHDGLSGPELAVAAAQRHRVLLAAIRALPQRSRDVFILTQLYHMPQADVASQLGISRGMVARHLARALEGVGPVLYGAG